MKTFIKLFKLCKDYPKPYWPYGKIDLYMDMESRLDHYLKYKYGEWYHHFQR